MGKTDIGAKIFDAKTITVDMFGFAFYRHFNYKMVTHARVFSLKPKFTISDRQGLFLANALHFLNKKFGYENMCSWEKIRAEKIQLPTKDGQIDFAFMESFISELEARHISELEAYLTVTGLKDYALTKEEEKALDAYKTLEWSKYKIGDLFERIPTQKLLYKAQDLTKEPIGSFVLPCLTSSFQNQGLNYYAPKDDATILRNVISIPSNSDVYRAYYQSREFTVLSDAYAVRWKLKDNDILPQHYLFMVMCINKVTDLPIYSYKNKLGGWNIVKEKSISLPEKDGKINLEFMSTLISAIQKLVIKDVALYADRKIKTTKEVVNTRAH